MRRRSPTRSPPSRNCDHGGTRGQSSVCTRNDEYSSSVDSRPVVRFKASYTKTRVCSPRKCEPEEEEDEGEEGEEEEEDDEEEEDGESGDEVDEATTTTDDEQGTDTEFTETSTQTDKMTFPEYYYIPPPLGWAGSFGPGSEKKRFGRSKENEDDAANANVRKYSSGGFDVNMSKDSDWLRSSYTELMKMLNAANNNQLGGSSRNELAAFPADGQGKTTVKKVNSAVKDKDKDPGKVKFNKNTKDKAPKEHKSFSRRQTGFPGKGNLLSMKFSDEEDDEDAMQPLQTVADSKKASPTMSETGKASPKSSNTSKKASPTISETNKSANSSGKGSARSGGKGKGKPPSSKGSEGKRKSKDSEKGGDEEKTSKRGSKDKDNNAASTAADGTPKENATGGGEDDLWNCPQEGFEDAEQGENGRAPQTALGSKANCVPGCIQAQLMNCFQTEYCPCPPCSMPCPPPACPSCCGVQKRRNSCCPPQAKSCCRCCHPKIPYFRPCTCQQCRIYHYCYNVINRTQIKPVDMFLGISQYENELRKRDILEEAGKQQACQPYVKGPILYNNVDSSEIPQEILAEITGAKEDPNSEEADMATKAQNWQNAPEGYKDATGGPAQGQGKCRSGCGQGGGFGCEPPCRINPWQTEYSSQFKDHSDNMRRTNSRYPYYDGGCCGGGRGGC